jgi:DNA mismatch repair ATPase MutL
MTRLLILILSVFLIAGFGLRADDTGKKPPDEKPRGDEIKPPKKPAQPEGESEEAKILERLTKNTKTVEKKLGDADTGDETRKLMREILKDIDELLKKAQQPPQDSKDDQSNSSSSPSGSSQEQPSDGSSAQQKKSSGSSSQQKKSSGLSRREQREQRRQQEEKKGGTSSAQNTPKPMGKPDKPGDKDPMANGAGTGGENVKNPMGGKPDGKPRTDADPKLAEMYKDVWGHLPEKMRQEMDSYFKEHFMPSYNELLKQYYSKIAEQNKKK